MNPKIETLRSQLNAQFPERRNVIDGVLMALLVKEHVLLLGPPGTAKSALIRAISSAFSTRYFERLMTKFSTPEELFGPISLKALEQDRFARVVGGKLPEAQFAFVDEVFKSNSAILNSLLTLMNERVFHNDGAPVKCPLVTLFGASNELPEGKELEAMFDRFLLRFDVDYLLRPSNLRAMLLAPEPTSPVSLTMADLEAAQAEVAAIKTTDATVDALIAVREQCRAEGISCSDRRWKKALKLAQAAAYLAGETETAPQDLLVLADSLWREPKERTKVARLVGKLADPVAAQCAEIVDAAREQVTGLQGNASDPKARESYIGNAAKVMQALKSQAKRLAALESTPRNKARIGEAAAEITAMHADLAAVVSRTIGLK